MHHFKVNDIIEVIDVDIFLLNVFAGNKFWEKGALDSNNRGVVSKIVEGGILLKDSTGKGGCLFDGELQFVKKVGECIAPVTIEEAFEIRKRIKPRLRAKGHVEANIINNILSGCYDKYSSEEGISIAKDDVKFCSEGE
ncbi:hypothetical protein [Vibrio phage RYC]|nr:hypothetical protein [Vibrio phage RYC]